MYKIIGADQKEYGPINAEQMRQWIAEGRVNGQTSVQFEGGEWRPLATFPEFADSLGVKAAGASALPGAGIPATLPPDFASPDYDLDIGGCISGAWSLLLNNFSLLFGAALIYLGIEFVIGVFSIIPLLGYLFSLGNLFILGPLMGGLYYVCLQAIRRQPATAGDVFVGFRLCYWQLFLGLLVPGLLASLCLVPVVLAGFLILLPSLMHDNPPGLAQVVILSVVALVGLVPMIFLQVNWSFTLPLVIDRRLEFWPAMQASWKQVRKHWWLMFGLALIIGVINMVGLLLCCVGLLFTVPLSMAALMYAYETVFSAAPPQTR